MLGTPVDVLPVRHWSPFYLLIFFSVIRHNSRICHKWWLVQDMTPSQRTTPVCPVRESHREQWDVFICLHFQVAWYLELTPFAISIHKTTFVTQNQWLKECCLICPQHHYLLYESLEWIACHFTLIPFASIPLFLAWNFMGFLDSSQSSLLNICANTNLGITEFPQADIRGLHEKIFKWFSDISVLKKTRQIAHRSELSIHFLQERWTMARSVVAGRCVNGFSKKDWVLALRYLFLS